MPELRLVPLEEMLGKAQLKELAHQLADLGIDDIPLGDDGELDLDEVLTEDQLTDFMDRLEARDLACDLYLPVEFDGRLDIGHHGIGSAYALLDALVELREELDIDEDASEEDEEKLDLEVIEEQLRFAWRTFFKAANMCIDKQIPLHIRP